MRIVVVEDIAMICDLVCRLCEREFGHAVVGRAHDGRTAIATILRTRPDVVILDLSLPDIDGGTVAIAVRRAWPKARFLGFSAFNDHFAVWLVEQAKLDGFVGKFDEELGIINAALLALAAGRPFFSKRFIEARREFREDRRAFDKRLSPRQREVLSMIGTACSDEEIARALKIAEQTAKTHRKALMRTVGVHSTRELIAYAIKSGLTRALAFRR